MRLVSSDPSFSWEGTLSIVLVVTLATVTMPAFVLAALFTPVFDLGALPLGRATAAVAGYGVLIAVSRWLFAIPVASGPPGLAAPLGSDASLRREPLRIFG